MKKLVLTLALTLALGSTAFAARTGQLAANDAYYQVEDVSIQEVVPTSSELFDMLLNPPIPAPTIPSVPPSATGGAFWDAIVGGDWNTIVLVGKQLVEIIKAGQPVVNEKTDVVAAIPVGVTDWQLLSGWQVPMSKIYEIQVHNKLHSMPVDLRVKITGMWGGSAGGRGQYLSNVMVVPTSTYVAWGYNLDLWSENSVPVNSGTLEAPIAALTFTIRYKVKTLLNEIGGAKDYYLTGAGKLDELPQ